MNTDFTTLINRYLSHELSDSEKATFEKELVQNKQLQEQVTFQKEIIEGIQRAATRSQIQKIGKRYHFQKGITTAGILLTIILTASILSYFIYNSISSDEKNTESSISSSLIEQLEAIAPIENLASEFFEWHGNDSIVLSKSGVLLSIPENAFLLEGKPYTKNAVIQWQEAKDAATIVKSGLSTMADDRLLETQGMFGFQAYTEKGEKLTVNPKVGVYVQTPVNEYKKDMQLFTGKKEKDGMINWTNPKPLEKIPVSVDMKDLDFYPKGYEAKLDVLKKPTNKKYRDSLYLSFDEQKDEIEKGNFKFEKLQTVIAASGITLSKKSEKNYNALSIEPFKLKYLDNKSIEISTKITLNEKLKFITNVKNNFSPYNSTKFYYLKTNKKKIIYDKQSCIYIDTIFLNRIDQSFEVNCNFSINVTKFSNNIKLDYLPDTVDNARISFLLVFKVNPIKEIKNSTIPPSKVLAFWNPKFNNTLLATREFEKRMSTIHSTCDEKLLDLYTSSLSRSMKSLDEKAVKMGYKQFNEYVSENIGAVNPDSPHYKNLERFYKNAIEQLQEKAKSNRRKQQEKDNQWDEDLNNERNKEYKRTGDRENKVLNEEYNFNLDNVGKQLGKTLGFQIHGGGTIFNIDKYVWDATVSRKTTTITDPETG
ncbi:MAG: hypothetical protein LW701_11565, partial [Fluviicola sp.]|nr:hypothetical protein [Fluviicola sp.]